MLSQFEIGRVGENAYPLFAQQAETPICVAESMEEGLTVECHVNVLGGDGYSRILTFQVVPRVGEHLGFSLDGKRDERGVLMMDSYRVKHVIHTAGNDQTGPIVLIDVEKEQDAHRT